MTFTTLFAIALALSTDNFAVALATGICLRRPGTGQTLRLAGAFGLFQAVMPVAGWMLGLAVRGFVDAYAGYVASGLLALVGLKMVREGFRGQEAGGRREASDPTRGLQLLGLAVSTSIDALAVGLSFSVLGESIWLPAGVIGAVCFLVTALGMRIGCFAGRLAAVSRYAEILGGGALLAVGLKIYLGA